jgi:hypothetical protein
MDNKDMSRGLYTSALTLLIAASIITGIAVFLSGHVQAHAAEQVTDTRLPEQLFDIRLLLDEDTFTSVHDMHARVEFVSFGRVPTPVELVFSIKDTFGKSVYTSRPETLIVETELSYPRRFLDVAELTPGTYTLALETRYKDDVVDTFSQAFTVNESSSDAGVFIVLGILALGAGIWIAYLIGYIRNKVSHDRIIAVTTRTAALVVAGVVLPTVAQMITIQSYVQQNAQANLLSSLTINASVAADVFVDYAQGVREEFIDFGKHVAYGTEAEVIAFATSSTYINAVHSIGADDVPQESMFRELGFVRGRAPTALPPITAGLYQRADGDWRLVATYPRLGGGVYRLEVAFTEVLEEMMARTHTDTDVLFVAGDGTVLADSHGQYRGEDFFAAFPEIASNIMSHEYYEETLPVGYSYTSRRVFIPTGQGVQWFYIVVRG